MCCGRVFAERLETPIIDFALCTICTAHHDDDGKELGLPAAGGPWAVGALGPPGGQDLLFVVESVY